MKSITYTAAREGLAATMQEVCDNREPIIITRRRDQAVVMIALEEYEAMQETHYLQRSPVNAERLQEAIAQLESGKGMEREVPEVE